MNMPAKHRKQFVDARTAISRAKGLNLWFSRFASETAAVVGHPYMFLLAVVVLIVWAVSGPLFHFSDTWQLIINTGTTIVTFLVVFLIQNTQNRDTAALQIKLAELILAVHGAKNKLATAEDLTEEELEHLHADYQRRANDALQQLE